MDGIEDEWLLFGVELAIALLAEIAVVVAVHVG